MKFAVSIPYQASIQFENNHLEVIGSRALILKVRAMKEKYNLKIEIWPLQLPAELPEDLLINEFIRKVRGETFIYNHEELCHCRMVKTETVKNAVKAGCHKVSDVSRTTLAGTGCGSCRSDIEDVIKALTA